MHFDCCVISLADILCAFARYGYSAEHVHDARDKPFHVDPYLHGNSWTFNFDTNDGHESSNGHNPQQAPDAHHGKRHPAKRHHGNSPANASWNPGHWYRQFLFIYFLSSSFPLLYYCVSVTALKETDDLIHPSVLSLSLAKCLFLLCFCLLTL